MNDLINIIIVNKEFFVILISLFGIVLPFWQFVSTKKQEQRQINFKKFHEDIVAKLSNQDGETGLDQQVAVVFELRNFPEYFPVSLRILKDLQINWMEKNKTSNNDLGRLIEEADETINYIKKCFVRRYFIRIWNRNF